MISTTQIKQSYYIGIDQPVPKNLFTTAEINIDKDLAIVSQEEIETQIRIQHNNLNDPFNKLK